MKYINCNEILFNVAMSSDVFMLKIKQISVCMFLSYGSCLIFWCLYFVSWSHILAVL